MSRLQSIDSAINVILNRSGKSWLYGQKASGGKIVGIQVNGNEAKSGVLGLARANVDLPLLSPGGYAIVAPHGDYSIF